MLCVPDRGPQFAMLRTQLSYVLLMPSPRSGRVTSRFHVTAFCWQAIGAHLNLLYISKAQHLVRTFVRPLCIAQHLAAGAAAVHQQLHVSESGLLRNPTCMSRSPCGSPPWSRTSRGTAPRTQPAAVYCRVQVPAQRSRYRQTIPSMKSWWFFTVQLAIIRHVLHTSWPHAADIGMGRGPAD